MLVNNIQYGYVEKTIFEKRGNQIHFFGYSYNSYNGTDTPYRFVEYTFFYADIKDVMDEGFYLFEHEHGADYQQYIQDCTEEEVNKIYTHYDNGNAPQLVCVDDDINDLPDGCYIAYDRRDIIEANHE